MNIKPLGFIDDNPLKKGKKLKGYPVLGNLSDLESLVRNNEINGLLISFRELNGNRSDRLKEFCHENGIYLKQFHIRLEDVRF